MASSNTSYEVIARKWRPQCFADLIGQEHITRTLQNSLAQGRTGHAYLFVGPRGTGKTTTARIFAKALNCEQGVSQEPCCECQSCREIAASSSLDVMEIDGASHNRVDDVRELRDNVVYRPSRLRYKIYIIDEVHMLTNQAWNALLKTLEEPPSHVKFFFATTEPHKLLPTVVSRCQRFDLRLISTSAIAGRLREIAQAEHVNIEDRAITAIARAAGGSMRDAQSVFDQIISFCGGQDQETITEEEVIDVFGLASGTELKEIVKAVVLNDTAGLIQVLQNVADKGRDLEHVYTDLLHYVRNVMIVTSCKNPGDLLEISADEQNDLEDIAANTNEEAAPRILNGLIEAENEFRHAFNKRVALEALLVRLMREAHSLQIDDLIRLLRESQEKGTAPAVSLSDAKAETGGPTAVGEPEDGEASSSQADTTGHATTADNGINTASSNENAGDISHITDMPEQTEETSTSGREETPAQTQAAQLEETEEFTESDAPSKEEHAVEEASEQPNITSEPAVANEQEGTAVVEQAPEGHQEVIEEAGPQSETLPQSAEATTAEEGVVGDPPDPKTVWARLRAHFAKGEDAELAAVMENFIPVSLWDDVFQVAFDENVPQEHVNYLEREDVRNKIADVLYQMIMPGTNYTILVKRWIEGISDDAFDQDRKKATPEVWEEVRNNSLVNKLCDMFDGSLIEARG